MHILEETQRVETVVVIEDYELSKVLDEVKKYLGTFEYESGNLDLGTFQKYGIVHISMNTEWSTWIAEVVVYK